MADPTQIPGNPAAFSWSPAENAVLERLLVAFRKLNKTNKRQMIKDLKANTYPDGYFQAFPEPEPLLAIQKMRVSRPICIFGFSVMVPHSEPRELASSSWPQREGKRQVPLRTALDGPPGSHAALRAGN